MTLKEKYEKSQNKSNLVLEFNSDYRLKSGEHKGTFNKPRENFICPFVPTQHEGSKLISVMKLELKMVRTKQ